MFTPLLAKHSKSFSLIDCVSVGVDRMQRSFEPMRKQVDALQRSELTDVTAKVVIYEAFVERKLGLRNTSPELSTICISSQRGVLAADDLQLLECVHLGIQRNWTRPAAENTGKAGRVSGSPILRVVLALRGGYRPEGCSLLLLLPDRRCAPGRVVALLLSSVGT